VTLALVFGTLVLILFVTDTTLLCWRVVKRLGTETSVWPTETLNEERHKLGIPKSVPVSDANNGHAGPLIIGMGTPVRSIGTDSILDDWIYLRFISKRTKCITTHIYYPFFILALLIVSRTRFFANYEPGVPYLVTMGVAALIVTACPVMLRLSAQASRAKARRRLNNMLIVARSLKDEGRFAAQLETLLHRVDELSEGAFSPFSQQPVVRAMLLPLGSLGGTALLEHFLLPGAAIASIMTN
jgi:hypothetical protein